MKITFKIIVAYAGLMLALHYITSWNNLYNTWWADSLLHTNSGIFFGLVWLKFFKIDRNHIFKFYFSLSIFALFGSYLWEVWEFFLWNRLPHKFPYKGELADTLLDMGLGSVGAALFSIWHYFFFRSHITKGYE